MGWQIASSRLTHDFSALPFKMKELTLLIKITPQVDGSGLRLILQGRYASASLEVILCCLLFRATTLISYSYLIGLSTAFLNFFEIYSISIGFALFFCRRSQRRILY